LSDRILNTRKDFFKFITESFHEFRELILNLHSVGMIYV
ncbi:MAG: hypothetical protein RIR56_538, partial [Bacteroidota bacterium]